MWCGVGCVWEGGVGWVSTNLDRPRRSESKVWRAARGGWAATPAEEMKGGRHESLVTVTGTTRGTGAQGQIRGVWGCGQGSDGRIKVSPIRAPASPQPPTITWSCPSHSKPRSNLSYDPPTWIIRLLTKPMFSGKYRSMRTC